MRRFLTVIGCFVLFAGVVFAAAPANNSETTTTSTATITSQHTGTWQKIDSLTITKTDTCDTYYHVTGTVTLDYGEKLYVGIANSRDLTADQADTLVLPKGAMGPMTLKFGLAYVDSLRSQTDATDTIFVVGAVAGSSVPERVVVTSVRLTGTVINYDAE